MGELSENISAEWNLGERPKKMNKILRETALEVSKCAVASAEGLTLKPDGVHFDSKSLREFGKRYSDVYMKIK